MSTTHPRTDAAARTVASDTTSLDAVWKFMTTVQFVKKHSGAQETFQQEKLERALERTMLESGLRPKEHDRAHRITGHIITRLNQTYDGTSVPSTDDIREMVVATLIDDNLAFVARKYIGYRQKLNVAHRQAPTYGKGITVPRFFTHVGVHPFDELAWERRTATIQSEKGDLIFEQRDVEVPSSWSQTATNIVVSKYFKGKIGDPERETSARELIGRVADTIALWGRHDGYFATEADADTFQAELTHILINQKAAFNSPVWFNVGINPRPQCSACFINSVEDDMRSIMNLATTETMLFKYGSGTGSNLSKLRGTCEYLSLSNGKSSGVVSFMKGWDAFAGIVKSGGKTRRAAKMVILNVDHPDIVEFIECKVKEEKKAWALIDAGYDGSFTGEAYTSIFFQNANNSVRVTDAFMRVVESDGEWNTVERTTGKVAHTYRARDVMRKMAQSAWWCGDPGIQYDTTINAWHTSKATGPINGSNPCVTGETLVATSSGYQRIKNLVGKTVTIVDKDGNYSRVERVFPTGRKPVFKLRTKSGYTLRLTSDHRVWTKNRGDVAAHDLLNGDVLVLKGSGFGEEMLPPVVAETIGMTVGDGCMSSQNDTVFIAGGRSEHAMLGRLNRNMNTYKRIVATDGRSARPCAVAATATGLRIGTGSRAIAEPMKEYAVVDRGSLQKQFTDRVFSLDRNAQAAILRGLFSADGTVANYGVKSQYVALDSVSEILIEQVQLLLLSFGIKSKIYRNRRTTMYANLPDGRGGKRSYRVHQMHSLRISRSSRVLFEREIGFLEGSGKTAKLQNVNRTVGAYVDKMEDAFVSLELDGVEDVFDLTEPKTHHFVANGLVIHNCAEYMFLDDTACNLSSLNLITFRKGQNKEQFDVEAFKHAAEVMITAMEILIGNSSYPTPAIEQNSLDYRPLGIGYANLGALLMSRGLPYDSEGGRNLAATITSLMSGWTYRQSAKIAEKIGPFAGFALNRESCIGVMNMHRDASYAISKTGVPEDLWQAAAQSWDDTVALASRYGLRNAQISVLAPTGTISFLMDCATTGIEPDIALVKYKWMVDGGMEKLVNGTVPEALRFLGYNESDTRKILEYIKETDTIEGAPNFKAEHLPVFDCAFKAKNGTRTIHYMGHVHMMAAVQPFLSGAISKTVNMPEAATVEEIERVYMEGWKLGLKAIAIYRDGSKRQQPLTTSIEQKQKGAKGGTKEEVVQVPAKPLVATVPAPRRRRLPDERASITHKFSIGGHKGYMTVGLYDDGTPGEMFIVMNKEGSVISGLMNALAATTSISLQYGVPLKALVNKFAHMRFEPSGFTNNPNIKMAKSIVDYVFRWMGMKFLGTDAQRQLGINLDDGGTVHDVNEASRGVALDESQTTLFDRAPVKAVSAPLHTATFDNQSDAPACEMCGSMMVRNAACYKCLNCGATSGCS